MTRSIQRQGKKKTRIESLQNKKQMMEYYQKGDGLFRFRNKSRSSTLTLPKPSAEGIKVVAPSDPEVPGSGEFEGDSYFLSLVPREIILVRTITAPGTQPVVESVVQETTEVITEETKPMTEEKLILDQPAQVTNEGAVEHVKPEAGTQQLNEQPGQATTEEEVLIVENPLDGVTIIRE